MATATENKTGGFDRAEYFRQRISKDNAVKREIVIPDCENPKRRESCLADPEKFLKTYLSDRFWMPFVSHHYEMIDAILHCILYGGDQANAAPRGEGKTEITKAMTIFGLLAGKMRFPVYIGPTAGKAAKQFEDVKYQFECNNLLFADFPEVCGPIRSLGRSALSAKKKTFGGEFIDLTWSKELVIFSTLHERPGPCDGAKFTYFGLDGAIRGENIHGERPDFILLDDPETRESASSEYQVGTRLDTLEGDIAGLAGPSGVLARVAIVTIQNTTCLAAKLTNPKEKPSWNGKRYQLINKWPDRTDLWEEYMALRKADMLAGDMFTTKALDFLEANFETLHAGSEVSNPERGITPTPGKERIKDPTGRYMVQSTLQWAYNFVADKDAESTDESGIEKFMAEFQNDPIAQPGPEVGGLTATMIQRRIHGLTQSTVPSDADLVTLGIDLGKYLCHWVKIAWNQDGCIGRIVDYGEIQVLGTSIETDDETRDRAILQALSIFRNEILAHGKIDFCLVDAGTFVDAAYGFIRSVGGMPFAVAKGHDTGTFSIGKESETRRLFHECYAHRLGEGSEAVWLYNQNVDYWKNWVHDRFKTVTFDNDQHLTPGSLSLYSPVKGDRTKHVNFSHQIVAEEWTIPALKNGKQQKAYFHKKSKENHKLDATVLACCAAGVFGVRLIPPVAVQAAKRAEVVKQSKRFTNRHGQSFLATER